MILEDKVNLMDKNKPIPEIVCAHCHLYTPEWRDRCIHCERKIEKPQRDSLREQKGRAA